MKLFAKPIRIGINFLQLNGCGCFSERIVTLSMETFDWFCVQRILSSTNISQARKAIAIDPSYIPKSGKRTPWIGFFWSGCARRKSWPRIEIMGIGVD